MEFGSPLAAARSAADFFSSTPAPVLATTQATTSSSGDANNATTPPCTPPDVSTADATAEPSAEAVLFTATESTAEADAAEAAAFFASLSSADEDPGALAEDAPKEDGTSEPPHATEPAAATAANTSTFAAKRRAHLSPLAVPTADAPAAVAVDDAKVEPVQLEELESLEAAPKHVSEV